MGIHVQVAENSNIKAYSGFNTSPSGEQDSICDMKIILKKAQQYKFVMEVYKGKCMH